MFSLTVFSIHEVVGNSNSSFFIEFLSANLQWQFEDFFCHKFFIVLLFLLSIVSTQMVFPV